MMPKFTALSGYRIMWIMAMFDLPVLTKTERASATKFREFLLDQGFEMMQFSCYIKFTPSKEKADALATKVGAEVPPGGKVDILFFTDAQYGAIKSFRGRRQSNRPEKPDQLQLF
jgi:CRISPR-associated protein Cas2